MTAILFNRNLFVYFISYFALIIAGLLLQINYNPYFLFEQVNQHYSLFLDYFFYIITYLGDGIFCILLSILFYFKNKKLGIQLIVAYVVTALIAQIIKYNFHEVTRPLAHYEHWPLLHFVLNSPKQFLNSFPSGHTVSAFAMATVLAYHFKNNYISVIVFPLALLVAYSRVYLVQHYVRDVFAAMIIGVEISLWICLLLESNLNQFLKKFNT